MYNVLIAEDDSALRFVYRKMKVWTEYGFRISAEAANGTEALKIFDKQSFDMIFTDIRMPFLGGLELLAEMRKMNRDVPVVLVSSYDDFEYARRGLVLGAFDYLLKPADEKTLGELLSRVENFLNDSGDKPELNECVVRALNEKIPGGAEDAFLRKVCAYLSKNTHRTVSMSDIADALGVSKDYFGKTFKRRAGVTFGEFYQAVRVEYAKTLLDTGNYKNYEISEKLGYSDPDYFTKVFREVTGVTPSRYKNAGN